MAGLNENKKSYRVVRDGDESEQSSQVLRVWAAIGHELKLYSWLEGNIPQVVHRFPDLVYYYWLVDDVSSS